mmetsp:Transcript_1047/g.1307  ORF Transcript_1047/g.1307 Transcript_1047/m.1307 type:complete len:218 (+) Transcript_1047:43-696(+)
MDHEVGLEENALFGLAKAATLSQVNARSTTGEDEIGRILETNGSKNNKHNLPLPPPAPSFTRRSSSLNSARGYTPVPSESGEWRRFLTVEERQSVREKIRTAYLETCPTYEDLLPTVVAIEEELLHVSAPSRLDYFKCGIQYDKRVHEKRKQFFSNTNSLSQGIVSSSSSSSGPSTNHNNIEEEDIVNASTSNKRLKVAHQDCTKEEHIRHQSSTIL